MKRKLVLYISMSVDGFIATNDDNLDWLSIVEKKVKITVIIHLIKQLTLTLLVELLTIQCLN
jgi:dihydrofolate reductase